MNCLQVHLSKPIKMIRHPQSELCCPTMAADAGRSPLNQNKKVRRSVITNIDEKAGTAALLLGFFR
jgi:hypothetical protein